jgi:hypothetical protein
LHEIALCIAQESETLTRNLDDAFAKFRLNLNLFAVFDRALGALSSFLI